MPYCATGPSISCVARPAPTLLRISSPWPREPRREPRECDAAPVRCGRAQALPEAPRSPTPPGAALRL
jgi:hypothetical protein